MTKEIKYNRDVRYQGKNSGYKQMGIALIKYGNEIRLQVIHSKDGYGHCFMEIPKENLKEGIEALKQFL